jgi:aquaporin Z
MFHRLAAEMIGTFWLVFGGCGSAVFAAKFLSGGVSLGIGFLGVALAFGLTVLTGGHFNPAVTLGAALARRVEWKALPGYWTVQVIGGLLAGLLIYLIAKGKGRFHRDGQYGGQRSRRALPGRLLAMGGDPRRDRPDWGLPARHPGIY